MKIFVKAKPGSRKEYIKKTAETSFIVSVTEPPVKGKANRAIIKLLAGYFGVNPSLIQILKGERSKTKIIELPIEQKLLGITNYVAK